ncbi:MAG: type II toxin-antitoxin system VapC family toxin [Spirochaetes bacterium]|nr:type II toxin-antitoxin system VapC family toxin [Spirochaetota bacterium]
MKVLIDTNILLWILFDGDELNIINDEEIEIIVSSISLFEISLKYSLNKLELKNITPYKIPELLLDNGYEIDNIDYKSFSTFYKLPNEIHKDPFDRLIIWESIIKQYYLLRLTLLINYFRLFFERKINNVKNEIKK